MESFPEYSILSALSFGANIETKSRLTFDENCNLILKSLKCRKFIIIFPFYWTHKDVAKFSDAHKNEINLNDLEWYLLELKAIMKGRKQSDINWIERVNFFHSIACTRFLNESQIDKEKLLYLMRSVSGFDLENPKFNNLIDISSYNFLSIKSDIDIENPIIAKALQSFSNKEVLINYAKYQIFYYGGASECIKKMQQYIKNEETNVVVPHTVLALNWLKKNKNFPMLENIETSDLLADLTNGFDLKTRTLLNKLSND